MSSSSNKPDRKTADEQLERICRSRIFALAQRSQAFLRYVVEKSLDGTPPKEYAIAADVLDRGKNYDPAIDATVRVEAGRLRSRLREYYAEEGKLDPLYIEIPKGGYLAVFRLRPKAQTPSGEIGWTAYPETGPEPARAVPPSSQRKPVVWLTAGAVCALMAVAGVGFNHSRRRPPEVRYTQLTDFTDSAVAPALSPDGRMLAFIRGNQAFLGTDEIYIKMLPEGEATRLTNDSRPKYGLAFSPDGSEIAYTVLEPSSFSTYTVSALGGDSRLLLTNAAGLVWLDPEEVLFSQIRSGIHMGVVTASPTRAGLREIYFPAHERGMAHYTFPSPDHRWALVSKT